MNYNRRRYSTTLMYLYRRSFPRKARRLLKEYSLCSPLTITMTRAIVTKAPWNVLVANRNRYMLVRAYRYTLVYIPRHTLVYIPRNLAGERRRARSTIVATIARPIKSTTVVATLLYAATIYFLKIPQDISSFV